MSSSIPHVKYVEFSGPLEILHLEPDLPKTTRHEVLRAIRAEYPGSRVSMIGDEVAVSNPLSNSNLT
jgi:hypothetical protein